MLTPAEQLGLAGAALDARVRQAVNYIPDSTLVHVAKRLADDARTNEVVYAHEGVTETVRIMFRPLRKVMNERETYIETVQKDIAAAEIQFEDLTNQIQAQENAVREEAFKQKDQLETSGSQQAAEIMASTREEINALRMEAQKDVDARISAARKHVEKESEDLAKHIIETVLYRSQNS